MITVTMQILSQYRDYSTMSGNIQATPAQWDSLYGVLARDDAMRGYNVILNQNGEMLDRDPADVAATVRQQTGGLQNVWVDYCVWPMRHRSGPLHFFSDNPKGLAEFIRALNPLMAVPSKPIQGPGPEPGTVGGRATDELTFQPPWVTSYPFKRGLSVNENLGRAPWADDGRSTSGWWVSDQAPAAVGESWGGFPQYTYSCFAFRYGAGYYFYAYGAGEYENHGVDPTVYAAFIRRVLTGQAGDVPGDVIIGPPAPPPIYGPPPYEPPPLDPGQPPAFPPGTQPPGDPAPAGSSWWSGLSQVQQAAVVAGAAAILVGGALLLHQDDTPGRSEG